MRYLNKSGCEVLTKPRINLISPKKINKKVHKVKKLDSTTNRNKSDSSSERYDMSSLNVKNSIEKMSDKNADNEDNKLNAISNSTKFVNFPNSEFEYPDQTKPRMSLTLPNYFKITTKFECTTIHEQNLSDAIEILNINESNAESIIDRFTIKSWINDLCKQYPYEALDYIDQAQNLQNNNRTKVESIIDFDSKIFFYK